MSLEKKQDLDAFLLSMTRTRIRTVVTDDQWSPVTVSVDNTISEAFEKMTDEGILSCPVVNRVGRYIGFIDMMDLVQYVTEIMPPSPGDMQFQPVYWLQHTQYNSTKVSDLRHRQMRKEVHPNFSLYHAFENLSKFGDHRLAVLEFNNRILGVVTQSMIINWIYENIDDLGSARTNSIKDMRPYSTVAAVNETALAIQAFNLMKEKDVQGLAVVDATGRLVDNISARDLRGINPGNERFRKLYSTVKKFKADVKENFVDTPITVQYVLPSATFEDVLRKMYERDIHRVFVVGDEVNRRPVDVITQTDVLDYLLRESTLMPTTSTRRSSGWSQRVGAGIRGSRSPLARGREGTMISSPRTSA